MSDKRKILIRFDDICPTMNWKEWNKATELLEKYNIKPLLGVIPECKDPDLWIDNPREDFWDYIKALEQKGYTIAMHGLYHQFEPGTHSEFAGLSYEKQYEKIQKGKTILISHGINTDIFFAPAHAYDLNTIKALSANGFKYMSDGFSLKPINRYGIVCLPCRSYGAGKIKRKGFFTCIFHAHEWSKVEKRKAYEILHFICESYTNFIVDFYTYTESFKPSNSPMNFLSEKLYLLYNKYIFKFLYFFYKNLVKPFLLNKEM